MATIGARMPNWKNLLLATFFLGFAAYLYLHHGSPWAIGLFFAASLYLGVLAFTGLSAGGVVDLRDAVDFVSNPADAIFERTLDTLAPEPAAGDRQPGTLGRIAAMIDGDADADAKSDFDPDAAIQRYMASRPADAAPLAAQSPAPRTFGRRGL
jgi:hypothetical protein